MPESSALTLTIRPAIAADLASIAAIYRDAVENGGGSYELEPPSLGEMGQRFEAVRAAGMPWIVAETDGAIAGYAYASAFRPRPAYRFMAEDSVYVAPEHKGKGMGKTLLTALIGELSGLGFRQVCAVIGDGKGNPGSVALHEALGFRHSGVIAGSGYKFGRWLDTVIMQLELNGGTASPPDPASLPEMRFRASLRAPQG